MDHSSWSSKEGLPVVQIQGDAIIIIIHQHYFHFVYESMFRVLTLEMHCIFEMYPEATILCSWTLPSKLNIEMMKALGLEFPTESKLMLAEKNTVYQVGWNSTIIVARDNDYHTKTTFFPIQLVAFGQIARESNGTTTRQRSPTKFKQQN